jgi:hypothetical protein
MSRTHPRRAQGLQALPLDRHRPQLWAPSAPLHAALGRDLPVGTPHAG